MFTGFVEEIGAGGARELGAPGPDGQRAARLTLRAPLATSEAHLGDSIAVSGVCLTVVGLPDDGTFTADLLPETLRRSALGDLAPGDAVNLERSLPVGGRYGGHVVQGHVDGVGVMRSRSAGPRWDDVVIALDPQLARFVAEKGAIAVAGVSLTVTAVGDDEFAVSLIPATLAATTLGRLDAGSRVNLEVDVLAKYTERLLSTAAVAR